MPMVRAMRLLNAIEAGTTTGAQLETLLTDDPGRLAELSVLLGMRGQNERLFASATATEALIASPKALNALVTSVRGSKNMAENPDAMNAVAASSTAMNAVAASSTAMNAVIASSTAMNAVAASSTAMNAVAASSTAMNAVAASSTAMNTVAASSTAMNAVAASSTAMNAIYASPTAIAAIAPTSLAVYGPHPSLLTLSGSNVTGWANARGTALSFVQSTAAAQPLFNNAQALNGYNTVNFDGVDDMLALNGNFGTALGTNYTAWFVYRTNASDAKGSLMGGGGTATAGGGANTDGIVLRTGELHLQESAAAAGGASRGTAYTHTAGTFGVLRVRRRGTTKLHLRLNAGAESAELAGQIPAFDNSFLTLGVGNENVTAGTTFLAGQLAEVFFITDGGLAGAGGETAEITRIHSMLGKKYGLYTV